MKHRIECFLYDAELLFCIKVASKRLQDNLAASFPESVGKLNQWLKKVIGTSGIIKYFTHLHAFPLLLLPWWLEYDLAQSHDEILQQDLVYSSINGYLYIRMIDNIMDKEDSGEISILPAGNFFHEEFQSVYFKYFSYSHKFWEFFHTTWMKSAEATIQDASLPAIDYPAFLEKSAKKTCAGKIPLMAVCHKHHLTPMPEKWGRFFDLMAAFHQMFNDLFDFQRDLEANTMTYFLSEGLRRKKDTDTVLAWVIHEGFDWGFQQMKNWIQEMIVMAKNIDCPGLSTYLSARDQDMNSIYYEVKNGFHSIQPIMDLPS